MAEYIYEIEPYENDEYEVFIGWIRNHSQELIRCKDCKYWDTNGDFPRGQRCMRFISYDYFWHSLADDYCSLAERKDDDTDK